MSEYNEQVMKLLNVIRTKPFLFPKGMASRMKFSLYFDWFEKHLGNEFNQMPAMVHFNPDILDQYPKKVVWTGFAPADARTGNYGLHTLVQVNKDFHIIFLYAQEENQVSVIATLYIQDVQDYLKFMDENERYIIRSRSSGFSGLGFDITAKDNEQKSK